MSTKKNKAKSAVLKRSVIIGGSKSSISLEDEFWNALQEIAAGRNIRMQQLIAEIDLGRKGGGGNLSSAVRLFVLAHFRDQND